MTDVVFQLLVQTGPFCFFQKAFAPVCTPATLGYAKLKALLHCQVICATFIMLSFVFMRRYKKINLSKINPASFES